MFTSFFLDLKQARVPVSLTEYLTLMRAMKAGAVDFLTKPVQRDALLRALESALKRDGAERKSRAILRDLRARYESLTAREREVLAHVIGGKLNKQIGFDLGTTERTIKAHALNPHMLLLYPHPATRDRSASPLRD